MDCIKSYYSYCIASQLSISSSSFFVFSSILEEISCNLTEFVETSSVCKSSVSSSFSVSSFSISVSIFLTSFSIFLSRACSSFCCFQLSFVSETEESAQTVVWAAVPEMVEDEFLVVASFTVALS